MKYKFIFIIISCSKLNKENSYHYSLAKYQILKEYNKIYCDLFKNDIKFFFIEYNDQINENLIEVGDFIYIKGQEDPIIPNLLTKNILAINYVNSKYEYDYILRTNLSSIWNIPKLLELYNEIPRQNFFGGHIVANSFITGTGIFISHDLVPKLLKINVLNFNCLDDVAISKHMINNNVSMYYLNHRQNYKMNFQILDENVTDINSSHHKNKHLEINDQTYIHDILYYRIRNSTLERDLDVTKKILKKIYNIDL